jgi:lambda repressor-like predicted transcriptional regulator
VVNQPENVTNLVENSRNGCTLGYRCVSTVPKAFVHALVTPVHAVDRLIAALLGCYPDVINPEHVQRAIRGSMASQQQSMASIGQLIVAFWQVLDCTQTQLDAMPAQFGVYLIDRNQCVAAGDAWDPVRDSDVGSDRDS